MLGDADKQAFRSGDRQDPVPVGRCAVDNSDMTSGESAGVGAFALKHRMAIWCLIPFAVVAPVVAGTRRLLSSEVEMNDLPVPRRRRSPTVSSASILTGGSLAIERSVFSTCSRNLSHTRSAERNDVAFVCGAGHVPSIVAV